MSYIRFYTFYIKIFFIIFIKYISIILVFSICFLIGNILSKKYILRVKELQEFQSAFQIIENKIKFTYEPLPDIFMQTAQMLTHNISYVFNQASKNMQDMNAEEGWNTSLKEAVTNLKKEDIECIKSLGKMLGKTDKDGQVSQLELTKTLLDVQIKKAQEEENKNAKLYKTLGTTVGLALVIILI